MKSFRAQAHINSLNGEKGKFKLIIINNENGETIINQNTNGIMMALSEEEGVRQLVLTNSTTQEVIHMLKILNNIIEENKQEITQRILAKIRH